MLSIDFQKDGKVRVYDSRHGHDGEVVSVTAEPARLPDLLPLPTLSAVAASASALVQAIAPHIYEAARKEHAA